MLDAGYTSTYYLLKSASNWMPWQRRMFVMLRQLGLDSYIAIENVSGVAKEGQPTEEIEAQTWRKWRETDAPGDAGDAEMIHTWEHSRRG